MPQETLHHVELNITAFRGKVVKQRKLANRGAADWLVLDVDEEELEQLRSCFELVEEGDEEEPPTGEEDS